MKSVKKKYLEIEFLDHCINRGMNLKPIKCKAIGILIGECKDAYYIGTWFAEDELNEDMESFTILKKTIIKINYLKYK